MNTINKNHMYISGYIENRINQGEDRTYVDPTGALISLDCEFCEVTSSIVTAMAIDNSCHVTNNV
jgi:hypothetical protein